MRINTQMTCQQSTRDITNSQAEWVGFGEQMSAGKHVINPSDDPTAASQAVVLSRAQAQNNQYTLARSFATQEVSLGENVLSQVTVVIQATQERVVYTGNGTLSDDDRASLATDLQEIRDQLMNLANGTDGNGRYIFGGYKAESAPFAQTDGAYSGGTTSAIQRAGASRTIVTGHTGDKAFANLTSNAVPKPGGSTQEENLFKMLNAATDALKTPIADDGIAKATAAAVIDETNCDLKNSLNNTLSVRTGLDTQLNELSSLDSLSADHALGQTQQMNNLVNIDWNITVSSYVMQQATLQTSYKVSTGVQGVSLFQPSR